MSPRSIPRRARLPRLVVGGICVFVVVGVSACGGSSGGAVSGEATGPIATSPPSVTGPVDVTSFTQDTQSLADALREFSATLAPITSARGFVSRAADLRRTRTNVERIVRRLGSYRVADASAEAVRARLVDRSRPLLEAMQRVIDRGSVGDREGLASAASGFIAAARDLGAAVTP